MSPGSSQVFLSGDNGKPTHAGYTVANRYGWFTASSASVGQCLGQHSTRSDSPNRRPSSAQQSSLLMPLICTVVSPFYAFEQSDWFGRIVVIGLVGASIIAWTIVLEKLIQLRQNRRLVSSARERWKQTESVSAFVTQTAAIRGPFAAIITAVTTTLRKTQCHHDGALKPAQLHALKAVVHSAVDDEVAIIEYRMATLGTIVSASPFIGLLGTVWGVMMAFSGMAAVGKADINAIAPGVSGALLTTVVALIVAIPALIAYNHLTAQIRKLALDLENFGDELVSQLNIERQSMEYDNAPASQ